MSLIKYNNEIIATLQSGQRATLLCKNKEMTGDVLIEASSEMKIHYNGESIATLQSGQRATLLCKNKEMTGDVLIEASEVQGYTVSGSWMFNKTPTLVPMEIEVDTLSHWYPEASTWGAYPFDDCHKIVITDTEVRFECGWHEGESSVIYSTERGWISYSGDFARVFSFNGEQVVSEKFYNWLNENATKVYDGMFAMLAGKWKFVDNPNINDLIPEDDTRKYDFFTGGLSEICGGFISRRDPYSEYYEYGIISIYRDSWDLPVIEYKGGAVGTIQNKVYYAPVYDPKWQGAYWRTMDYGPGVFVDLLFFEWLVGYYGDRNAAVVESEDSEVDL